MLNNEAEKLSKYLNMLFQHASTSRDAAERDRIDRYIASFYRQYPEMLSVPNEDNNLPIWDAYIFKLHATFRAILQLNQTPRAHDRIVCAYCLDGQVPLYFTDMLDPKKYSGSHSMQAHMVETAYQLLPSISKSDAQTLAPIFLRDIEINTWELTGLQCLIKEGFDLSIEINYVPFIDRYTSYLITTDLFEATEFFRIQGLLITKGMLDIFSYYASESLESDLCRMVYQSVQILTDESKFDLDTFICNFNHLYCYHVDLRKFKYFDNRSLIELATQSKQPKETLDFILGRPKQAATTEKPWLMTYDEEKESLQPEMQVSSFSRNTPSRSPV